MKKLFYFWLFVLVPLTGLVAADFDVEGNLRVIGNTDVNGKVLVRELGDISMGEFKSGPTSQPTRNTVTTPPTTGLFAWYSADEAYAETMGTPTTKVTVDNTGIGSLKDRSGNSRNLYQSTTTNQPAFKTSAVNGRPAILFDGNSDMMSSLSQGNQTQPITAYFVIKQTGSSNNRGGGRIFCFTAIDQNYLFEAIQSGEGSKINLYSTDSSVGGGNSDLSLNQYGLFMVKLNGTQSFSKVGSSTQVNYVGSNTSLLDKIIIGNYVSQPNLYAGLFEFAEAIIYNSAHDPSIGDGLTVRKYLDAKYNLGLGIDNGADPALPSEGLFARYNASKVFKDVARTQPCSISGVDLISSFEDLSGNNRHASTVYPNNMTTWVSGAVNGKPVSLGSSYSVFRCNGINIPSTAVIYVLFKGSTGTMMASSPDYQPRAHYDLANYLYPGTIASPSSWITAPDGLLQNTWQLLTMQMGPSGYLKINSSPLKSISTSFTVPNNDFGFDGALAEYIIYSAQHDPSSGNGLLVRKYFNEKYGLGLTLP